MTQVTDECSAHHVVRDTPHRSAAVSESTSSGTTAAAVGASIMAGPFHLLIRHLHQGFGQGVTVESDFAIGQEDRGQLPGSGESGRSPPRIAQEAVNFPGQQQLLFCVHALILAHRSWAGNGASAEMDDYRHDRRLSPQRAMPRGVSRRAS